MSFFAKLAFVVQNETKLYEVGLLNKQKTSSFKNSSLLLNLKGTKHIFSYFGIVFSFQKHLETYFQFLETIETRQNSEPFRTVSYFAKLKKIRNCHPYLHAAEPFPSVPAVPAINLENTLKDSSRIVF